MGIETAVYVLAAATAYSSYQSGQASKRQYAAEQRKAEIQNVRSVRQQIREARMAQASMTNVAAQTGGMGGSALAGGLSSVGSQLASNASYMADIARENTAITNAASSAATWQANATIFSSLGNVAGTMAKPTATAPTPQ